jgi:hypothetical protein
MIQLRTSHDLNTAEGLVLKDQTYSRNEAEVGDAVKKDTSKEREFEW